MHSFLSEVTDLIALHPDYAAWAVFLLAFSEAIPVIGTVVPGSTLVVAVSALALDAQMSAWVLITAATLGAIMGDGAAFWLGLSCHRQILERWPLNRFPRLIATSQAFFDRYGGASVFLARFTAVVRAFVPLIAGIVQMPARQFYLANILSAIVWALAHVFPGVAFGFLARHAGAHREYIFILAIAAMIVVIAIERLASYWLRWRRKGGSSS
ncbi:MAG TPA: DedA family protein [Xanthobacteraceae bacterium]|nr:DedA family protein [Xanthobacteraceae bacterium]